MCAIAPKRIRQSERAAFKAANIEQTEFKMHTMTNLYSTSTQQATVVDYSLSDGNAAVCTVNICYGQSDKI